MSAVTQTKASAVVPLPAQNITWTGQGSLSGQSASAIALTMAGREVVCVYTGTGGEAGDLYSTFRTPGTGGWNTVQLPFTSVQPCGLAVDGNETITCAFVNSAVSQPAGSLYWFASTDPAFPGAKASAITYAPPGSPAEVQARSNFGPALVWYNNALYCVFVSLAYELVTVQLLGDGSWHLVNVTAINTSVPASQPALAVLNGVLYGAVVGTSTIDNQLLFTTFSANGWSSPTPMGSNMSASSFGLTASNAQLVCVYKGVANDNLDFSTWTLSGGWSAPQPIPGQTASIGPAATGSNPVYVIYEGDGDGGLYWVTGT